MITLSGTIKPDTYIHSLFSIFNIILLSQVNGDKEKGGSVGTKSISEQLAEEVGLESFFLCGWVWPCREGLALQQVVLWFTSFSLILLCTQS